MKKLPAHLRKHAKTGIYYFRVAIPSELQPFYKKLEVNHSLHTREPALAKAWSYALSARYFNEFSRHRLTMTNDTDRLPKAHSWLDDVAAKERKLQEEEAARLSKWEVKTPSGMTVRTDPLAPDQAAEHARGLEALEALGKYSGSVAPVQVEPPKPKVKLTPISVAIAKHLADKNKGPVNEQEETERSFNLLQFKQWHEAHLIEHYQDCHTNGEDLPVLNINKSVFGSFKNWLFDDEEYAWRTVEKKGLHIRQFLDWCKDHLDEWPDAKINPLTTQFKLTAAQKAKLREESGYQPFSEYEVQKIFDPTNFHSFLEIVPPNKVKKPHNFFMPLLGLYTGARLNELAKCEISDFYDYDGIWGIHIRGTKNKSSEAWIALHPALIKAGLLEYAEFLKQQGHTMLFPYLNKGKKGYGKTSSDAFQKYLRELGIKQKSQEDPKKGFHSFRDTVNVTIQNCKGFHCDSENRYAFLRHTHHSVNLQFYGAKFAVHKTYNQVVPALNYPITVPYFHDYLGSFEDITHQIETLQKQHVRLKKSKAKMKKEKVK